MMELPRLTIAAPEIWERAYETAIERNFFQSPHWGKVVSQTYGFVPYTMAFDWDSFRVVLPCLIHRRLRGGFLGINSMPPFHYGGLLSERPLSAEITLAIAERLSREWWVHTLVVSSSPGKEIVGWRPYQATVASSHVLDLRGGYAAVWETRFDAKQRNSVRKAQRSGLAVRKDNSIDAMDAYYELYLLSCRRWNQPHPEPRIYFETLLRDSAPCVELWLASKDHRAIAGIILASNGRDTAYYLANASDADYWEYAPNNLLLASAIEETCARGFAQFDFLPSGRIPTVEQFKAGFGALQTPVPQYWLKGRLPSLKKYWMDKMCGGLRRNRVQPARADAAS